jgi:hypothetical protein
MAKLKPASTIFALSQPQEVTETWSGNCSAAGNHAFIASATLSDSDDNNPANDAQTAQHTYDFYVIG